MLGDAFEAGRCFASGTLRSLADAERARGQLALIAGFPANDRRGVGDESRITARDRPNRDDESDELHEFLTERDSLDAGGAPTSTERSTHHSHAAPRPFTSPASGSFPRAENAPASPRRRRASVPT